ncbi:MAG: hypothetical protein ACI9FG_001251 [Crocinitomicaceae bacterium]
MPAPVSAYDVSETEVKERTSNLKHLVKGLDLGVYIYSRTLDTYVGKHKSLSERCSALGITEVYLSFSSKSGMKDKKYQAKIQQFIGAFHEVNILVYASFLDHRILVGEKSLDESLQGFKSYNKSSKKSMRFDGICADIEPHIIKIGRNFPKTFKPRWDGKNGYGKGLDNDLLVQQTISLLGDVREALPDISLAQSIPHFFHHHAVNGDMEKGRVSDFLTPCDFVVLMAYSDQSKKIFSYSKDELKDNKKKKSVMIAMKSSIKTKGGGGDSTSLHGAGWKNMILSLKDVIKNANKHSSFRGISFFEFEGLETMLTKK